LELQKCKFFRVCCFSNTYLLLSWYWVLCSFYTMEATRYISTLCTRFGAGETYYRWHKTSLPFQHYCITIVGFHLELRSAIKQVMVFLWVIRCTIHYSYKYMFVFFESWWLLLPPIFKWGTHFAIHDQSWKWLKSWHLQGE
jgi:hypothetical protein